MSVKVKLRKTSLVDYPGCISSVIFFRGCNLRCPWCHNRDLVLYEGDADTDACDENRLVTLEEVFAHLLKRRTVLGGVVLSGGEPCLYEGLPDLIFEIKKIPLAVKLDTNGMFPVVLGKLFSCEKTRPDYIAMDLKLSPERYTELLPPSAGPLFSQNSSNPAADIVQSAALIRASGIPHEFRSLELPKAYFTEKDKEALAPLAGDSPWILRPFRGGNCLDPVWDSFEQFSKLC